MAERCVSYGQAFISSQRRVLQIGKWEVQKCSLEAVVVLGGCEEPSVETTLGSVLTPFPCTVS